MQDPKNLNSLILDAALTLFTEKGYFNTSVRDIQKTAGVSTGAVYHHFKSKEEIAKALYDDMVLWLDTTIDRAVAGQTDFYGKCRELIRSLLICADEHPKQMRYIFYAKHQEFMPEEKPICSSNPFGRMLELAAEGMDKGLIKKMKPIVAVSLIFGGMLRMISLKLDGIIDYPLIEDFEDVFAGAFSGLNK